MKKKTKKRLTIILVIITLLLVVGGVFAYNYYTELTKPFDGEAPVRLYIRSETGAAGLRDSLISSLDEPGREPFGEHVYNVWKKTSDNNIVRTGSYIINPGDKALNISRRISRGMEDPVKVTFNNIRTLDQLYARLAAQLAVPEEQLAAAADSILTSSGVKKENFISRFQPDTYEFYWSASAPQVIERLLSYYDQFWTEERIDKAKRLNLTPDQVVTLASIVEEESAKSDEHATIAGLYLNRLQKGMMLQADPTVKFAYGDFAVKRITNDMLNTPSPYNTYIHTGLPPGPIRMPSKRTIDAVLNSGPNNYLYMCAKEDFSGYHNFTSNYNTHLANARRYQQALNARGIR